MTGAILGFDIGGANVKAARIDDSGPPLVVERPFALWRDPAQLPIVLKEVAERLGPASLVAVTMTAELADCFATKREGVARVIDACEIAWPGIELLIYGVDGRFRSAADARRRPLRVAAANWMASATLAAGHVRDGIFLDVGSTTTDIIPIAGGRVRARGRTDPGRLRRGELVYTGALRTPVCAIVRSLPLRGRRYRVAAEHFAIAADAHRWLGHLDEAAYTCDTPDGRGRSRRDAGARLARMVCADLDMLRDEDITSIAARIARAQAQQIASGIRQVVRRLERSGQAPSTRAGQHARHTAIVAGSGAFLARTAAREAGLPSRDLADALGADLARATPAVAVALLLARQLAPNAGRM